MTSMDFNPHIEANIEETNSSSYHWWCGGQVRYDNAAIT